ncbi:MAG: hypothetical protein GXY36_07110 [Chloroflexi bacterium]|nr:hypothetical protein [Chloroflexota bacterium]
MLKGLRLPLLALVLAAGLLLLALLTRPDDNSPGGAALAQTVSPSATPPPAESAADPVSDPALEATPLPPAVPPAAPENILVEALVGQIYKINPLLATYNPVDRDITSLIFEGLTTTNDYGEIVPDLAASWKASNDGLEYIVALREDILWQDGIPFTARDVVFTINLISDPQFPGADELQTFWRTVEVDALGDYMLRFRLTQPLASFVDQLRIGIVPEHALRGVNVAELGRHPFNLSPIGTGPYQIESLTSSGGQIDGIQLRVAPVYRQRPEGQEGYLLDRVIFRTYPDAAAALDAYSRGEVNSIGTIPPEQQAAAQQMPGLGLYTGVAPRVGVMIYNWKREPVRFVRNPRVRLALAHATNREALVTQHLGGLAIPADSPLLPTSWAYRPGVWPVFDLARAQAMLDMANIVFDEPAPPSDPTAGTAEATEPAPEGGTPAEGTAPVATGEATDAATEEPTPAPAGPTELAMTILTADDPALAALAEGIAADWRQIGFRINVETADAGTLLARLEAGDFDAALIELSFEPSADPDPFVFWHQGQYGSGQNFGGMDDRRVSEGLEMARRDANGMHRLEYYHRFQTLFAERAPALVLYYPLYVYAADSRLQGVQITFLSTPSDRFRTIQDWYFTRPE